MAAFTMIASLSGASVSHSKAVTLVQDIEMADGGEVAKLLAVHLWWGWQGGSSAGFASPIFAVEEFAHGLPAGLVRFLRGLAFVGVHASLGCGVG